MAVICPLLWLVSQDVIHCHSVHVERKPRVSTEGKQGEGRAERRDGAPRYSGVREGLGPPAQVIDFQLSRLIFILKPDLCSLVFGVSGC